MNDDFHSNLNDLNNTKISKVSFARPDSKSIELDNKLRDSIKPIKDDNKIESSFSLPPTNNNNNLNLTPNTRPGLFFRKIDKQDDLAEYKNLEKNIDLALNNVDQYFKRTINGKQLYIVKSFPQRHQSIRRMSIIHPDLIDKNQNFKNKRQRKHIPKRENSYVKYLQGFKSILPSSIIDSSLSNDRRNDITDQEIQDIYNKFKEDIKPYKADNKPFINNLKNKNNEREHLLYLQTKILQKQKSYDDITEQMHHQISKKLRRKPQENQIQERIGSYRVIQELKDTTDFQKVRTELPVYKWYMNLRSTKNEPGIRKNLFNLGNDIKPKWTIMNEKFPYVPETVRQRGSFDEKTKKSFFKNSYLQSHKVIRTLKKSISQLDEVYLKGKNLLNEEISCFKAMSGKKKLTKQITNIGEKMDIVFADNSDNYQNQSGTTLISSCHNLHC